MVTYPNQKVITVHKQECKKDFLQINNTAWQAACEVLTYSAFKLFLYMADNKDGYSFALSYEAVNDVLPMNRNTYDKAIKELRECGYLTQTSGNNWTFSDN